LPFLDVLLTIPENVRIEPVSLILGWFFNELKILLRLILPLL